MRRVALIYNPVSGQNPKRRAARIAEVVAALQLAGAEVKAIATVARESAGTQARAAMREGCDTIIACGGDGTVHEILQSLVGEDSGEAALGVIPMGTANALAADLGMPRSPTRAVKKLLGATAVRVPVGKVQYQNVAGEKSSRHFIVAAGIGADALLMSRLDAGLKQRFGYALYIVETFRLWVTHTFPTFSATFKESSGEINAVKVVTQLLAIRIGNFGGVLNNFVPGAALSDNHLRVVTLATRSRMRYLRFMIAVLLGRHTYSGTAELIDCASVECSEIDGQREKLFVEADGELLGTLSVRIEVVPQAVTLLIPEKILRRTVRRR
jgi:YegS/Rv2252/BmrU family lipid kinase